MSSVFKFVSLLPSIVFGTLMGVLHAPGWAWTCALLFITCTILWVLAWWMPKIADWVTANIDR